MSKKLIAVYVFLTVGFVGLSADFDSLFMKLDSYIEQSESINQVKYRHIESLNKKLNYFTSINKNKLLEDIFDEYQLHQYDSAFKYAMLYNKLAFSINNDTLITNSRLQFGQILTTKGLFKEAFDTINLIDQSLLIPIDLKLYYKTLVRLYFGLEHYGHDTYYGLYYHQKVIESIDSVIVKAVYGSVEFNMYNGLRNLAISNLDEAVSYYQKVVNANNVSIHNLAQSHATIGFLYKIQGNITKARYHLIEASIYDIKGSIKETTALRGLSELLFENNEVQKAYKYIQIAKNDAEFYGTQLRILEVSNLLANIEGKYLLEKELEHSRLRKSNYFISILAVLFLLFSAILSIQFIRLHKARKEILKSNKLLKVLNANLSEANIIKEEYIGYSFTLASQYIEKIDRLKKAIDNQITARQYAALAKTLRQMELKKERELLFTNFDEVFLNLFPSFINDYNSLIDATEDLPQIDNQLSTAQRIFALIRLGITDNEKIGNILNLSVNTIYTYKTKEKNKSKVSNDQFEKLIMQIGSS